MHTILSTFSPQKKSKKKGYARHEFSYDELYLDESLEEPIQRKKLRILCLWTRRGFNFSLLRHQRK